MKILITGSNGFIAKNLIAELRNRKYGQLLLCSRDTESELLERYVEECDILVHLAGVNRPRNEEEYYTGNVGFTESIVHLLEKKNKQIHIIYSSTTMTARHEFYRECKRKAEKRLQDYAEKSGSVLSIFRLPNVFGKWCRPNYNSVVATFCYNISHDLDIQINDPDAQMKLVYIDDVIEKMISCMSAKGSEAEPYPEIQDSYQITVRELAEMLYSFKTGRKQLEVPYVGNALEKKLYSTYLSYLEPEDYCYELKMNRDERGSFTEFMHLLGFGQISVNIVRPGIVKGNHWHHTKVEKFLVVKGTASIKLRHIITGKVTEFITSGEKFEVVDIPVGYTHNISNIGTEDLVTIMWANEVFDLQKSDTYYEEV